MSIWANTGLSQTNAAGLQPELGIPFRDNAVLQRDIPLPIWGATLPDAEVTVNFGGQTRKTAADANGRWRVELDPIPAARLKSVNEAPKGTAMTVLCEKDGETATAKVRNLIMGDVWLCAGQSNMAGRMRTNTSRHFPSNSIAKASYPALRHFVSGQEGPWLVCSPETAPDFKKVAFFFGRRLQQDALVPIGLMVTAVGGSRIETWLNQKPFETGGNYTKLVEPLVGCGLRGVVWYQGESNAKDGLAYGPKLRSLILGWRRAWGQGDFPVYYVQLPGIGRSPIDNPAMGDGRAAIRESQLRALALKNTGMAVTIDIGAVSEHPPNKYNTGVRLARIALHNDYGLKDLVPTGPIYKNHRIENGLVRIHFDNAQNGLMFAVKEGFLPPKPAPDAKLGWLSIRGKDGTWRWAESRIEGNELVVFNPEVKEPTAVRYAYTDNPIGPILYNKESLPACPFSTCGHEDKVQPMSANSKNPNIILILADDLGYGDVGCYNPESKVPTPNLDKLSREGMLFTDAHSPATVCTPSRYSVLTGRMAFRTGLRGVFTGAGGPCLIEKDRLTLPGILRDKGYATACFGKWHIGLTFLDKAGEPICENGYDAVRRIDFNRSIPDAPIHRGFDQFYGTACCSGTDYLYAFIDGDRIPVPPTGELDKAPLPKHPYSRDNRKGLIALDFDIQELDQLFLKKSVAFMEEHVEKTPDKPFFLFHPSNAVHLPSFASSKCRGKTDAGPHGDFIYEFDSVVGELMATLDRLGIADNTLVMVTSDNGPEVTSVVHMRKDHKHDGARPWRGMKRDNWEGGHRIPFIARWPERIKAGSKTDQTTCLCDIMATCAALVGADLPQNAAEDSFNILPVMLGKQPEDQPIRKHTLHQTNRLALSIRKGKWKYLDHVSSGGNPYDRGPLKEYDLPDTAPGAPGQLYNLDEDPGETTNLYFEHPELVEELRTQLHKYRDSGRSVNR